jgi:hypothetical protein
MIAFSILPPGFWWAEAASIEKICRLRLKYSIEGRENERVVFVPSLQESYHLCINPGS